MPTPNAEAYEVPWRQWTLAAGSPLHLGTTGRPASSTRVGSDKQSRVSAAAAPELVHLWARRLTEIDHPVAATAEAFVSNSSGASCDAQGTHSTRREVKPVYIPFGTCHIIVFRAPVSKFVTLHQLFVSPRCQPLFTATGTRVRQHCTLMGRNG